MTVTNTGSSINGVQVNDLLPSGLTFSTSSASQGSYNGTTGLWSVGTLGNNASATLSIKAFAAFPGDKTNTATATGGGFSSSKSIVVTPQQVNVAVGTSVNGRSGVSNPLFASVNQGVTFTIVVSNAVGYTAAKDVVVSDVMTPSRLTLSPTDPQFLPVNPSASQGSYNYNTGV